MADIPRSWQDGPHTPIAVEGSWRSFVRHAGGTVLDDILPKQRPDENADFLFADASVAVELKEVETEFSRSPAFIAGFSELQRRVLAEDPEWRPILFGGDGSYPPWYLREFVRLFRPPLSRILKKANRQLRETMTSTGMDQGVLLLVNDGFTSLGPDLVRAQVAELLVHSYSSITCFVYLTVNRYVEIARSYEPKLLWVPAYSERATPGLVEFVDDLGRKWFDYLETLAGPFTSREESAEPTDVLFGSRAIVLRP